MGFLLHAGATVQCSHGGTAQAAASNSKVTVNGQPTVLQPAQWTISGCTLPSNAGGPCATAQFTTAATRITSNGQPLLLKDSRATCIPPGTPLNVTSTQMKVKGK